MYNVYPSRLHNMSQCVCRLHTPSCAIVKQCRGQNMRQGMIVSPLCRLGAIQLGPYSKWWLQPISLLAFDPRDTMVHNARTKTLSLLQDKESVRAKDTFITAHYSKRKSRQSTKQVQVWDAVRERYASTALQLIKTATTAPEAWEAMDSCCRVGACNRKRRQRANCLHSLYVLLYLRAQSC